MGGNRDEEDVCIQNTAARELREESCNLFNVDIRILKDNYIFENKFVCYFVPVKDQLTLDYFHYNRQIIKKNKSPQCWKEKDDIVRVYVSDFKSYVEKLKFTCENCETRTDKLYDGIKYKKNKHVKDKICEICYNRRLTDKQSLQNKLSYNLYESIICKNKLFDADNIKEVNINRRAKSCLINGLLQLNEPLSFNDNIMILDQDVNDINYFINSTKSYKIKSRLMNDLFQLNQPFPCNDY